MECNGDNGMISHSDAIFVNLSVNDGVTTLYYFIGRIPVLLTRTLYCLLTMLTATVCHWTSWHFHYPFEC
jgi:hypothetical protein